MLQHVGRVIVKERGMW